MFVARSPINYATVWDADLASHAAATLLWGKLKAILTLYTIAGSPDSLRASPAQPARPLGLASPARAEQHLAEYACNGTEVRWRRCFFCPGSRPCDLPKALALAVHTAPQACRRTSRAEERLVGESVRSVSTCHW